MADCSKILVIRFSSIGDIVLSTPLLRLLRARFPKSQIDYATKAEFAELVRTNQNLNYTYEFNSAEGFDVLRALKKRVKAENYDLIVDIHDSLRSRYLRSIRRVEHIVTIDKRKRERTLLVLLKKNTYTDSVPVADRYIETVAEFGIANDGKGLELHIPDTVRTAAASRLAPERLNRFEHVLGFCPSAKHETKRWPPERFVELGIRLAKRYNAKLLLFGGREDTPRCAWIAQAINAKTAADTVTSLAGSCTLMETAAAMEFCDLVVSNDSGLMHIATAMGRKLLAIFGSTVREFGFFPYGGTHLVLERSGLPCRPCSHIGRQSCPEQHFRCMNDITVDAAEEAARLLLRKPPAA